ncbi:MAG: site-specific integrase [Brevinematales bacterium]|jgi:integrase
MAYWDNKDRAYYASVILEGKRKRIKLHGITRKKDADIEEDKIKFKISIGEFYDLKKQKPARLASELITLYIENWAKVNNKGWRQDENNIKRFIEVVGDKKIEDYTTLDIDIYKRERQKSVKNTTINRELNTISGFFSKLEDWGELKEKKVKLKDIPVPYDEMHRDRIPTPVELRQIFESIHDPELFLIIETLCMTGLRRSDVLDLTIEKLKFDQEIIQYRQTMTQGKTGKRVTIILHPRLRSDLILWIQTNGIKEGKLFSMTARELSDSFSILCRLLNIKDLVLHDLRHVFGTTLAATRVNGISIDPFALSKLMGHSDIKMTDRYINPLDEYKKQFIDNMPTGFLPEKMPDID